jgi:hypothetical protein
MVAAAVVAGVGGGAMPIVGGVVPDFGLAELASPFAVAGALWHGGAAVRPFVLEAVALTACAAAIGSCRRRGPWGGAVFGALLTTLTLLADPGAAAIPLVAAGWICAAVLAAEPTVSRPPMRLVLRLRSALPLRPRLHPVQES